ncbi:MAG: hypothetical protein SVM80_03575 [Halobacteriota archaeon]|nr:hypothetical protein [Halobacteriota archaeon]
MKEDLMDMLKYMFVGAIGFGFGGFFWDFLIKFYKDPFQEIMFGPTGGFIFGLFGGLSLYLLSNKKIQIIIYAVIGYVISGLILFSPITRFSVVSMGVGLILTGFGAIAGGLFIGLALKRLKLFIVLGALGYITGMYVFGLLLALLSGALNTVLLFTGLGIGTGLFLGLGMYLAEYPSVNPKE